MADFSFSPSAVHHLLLDSVVQQYAFDAGDSLTSWQEKLRAKISTLTGYENIKAAPDLSVRSRWTQDDPRGSIEKIVFTSEPAADVPAYVCLPRNTDPPYTFFICVQGHSSGMHNSIGRSFENEFENFSPEGDRAFALDCMERGIAALCIEQRAFGYRREEDAKLQAGSCSDAAMHALMLGRTLIAERVFDVQCGINYLNYRGDVRMDRLGLMGNSGGGTISMFSAALLPQLQFVMPSCYFCSFRDSIMSISHCVCNFVPHLYRYAEMSDVMGLFAPKPVVIVCGKQDEIFPIDATRKEFAKLKAIYRAAGAEQNCTLVEGSGGHRFYAERGWKEMGKYL